MVGNVLLRAVLLLSAICLARPAAAETLRVNRPDATDFTFMPLDLGAEQGVFARHGIALQNSVSPRGQQLLIADSADIAIIGGTDLALVAKGAPTRAIAVVAGQPYGLALVVRADSPADLASLKGRPVGVATTSSITAWMAREFARQQGWGANGVVLVATGGTDSSVAGLVAKNLDAAVLSTETGFQLQEAGRGRVALIFGDVVGDFLTHLVYARNSVIADRPDALRQFLRGWFETIGFMHDHRDATIAFFATHAGISPSLAAQTYDRQMATFTRDGHFPAKSVDRILRATIELGQLAEMPATPGDLYDERFLPPQ